MSRVSIPCFSRLRACRWRSRYSTRMVLDMVPSAAPQCVLLGAATNRKEGGQQQAQWDSGNLCEGAGGTRPGGTHAIFKRIKAQTASIQTPLCSHHTITMLDEAQWRVQQAADYICGRQFSVVTLQFPDEQLQYAALVATAIQANCASRGHAVQVRTVFAVVFAAAEPCWASRRT